MGNTRLSMNPKVSNPNQGIIFIKKKNPYRFQGEVKGSDLVRGVFPETCPESQIVKIHPWYSGRSPSPGLKPLLKPENPNKISNLIWREIWFHQLLVHLWGGSKNWQHLVLVGDILDGAHDGGSSSWQQLQLDGAYDRALVGWQQKPPAGSNCWWKLQKWAKASPAECFQKWITLVAKCKSYCFFLHLILRIYGAFTMNAKIYNADIWILSLVRTWSKNISKFWEYSFWGFKLAP